MPESDIQRPSFKVLGIVGWSGAGKTTLIEKLIPELGARGIRCGVIKHAHHSVDMDTPGKDSYRFRAAGAVPVVLASSQRWAMMVETPEQSEPSLNELIAPITLLEPDIILVEGFKHTDIPKLEVHRPEVGKPLLCDKDCSIRVLATPDSSIKAEGVISVNLNEITSIADWIEQFLAETKR